MKKRIVLWLISRWLPDYHLSKNPPKGTTKTRKPVLLVKEGAE